MGEKKSRGGNIPFLSLISRNGSWVTSIKLPQTSHEGRSVYGARSRVQFLPSAKSHYTTVIVESTRKETF